MASFHVPIAIILIQNKPNGMVPLHQLPVDSPPDFGPPSYW
jgi:hypothetical protein